MSRAARDRRVFFVEEPIEDGPTESCADGWLETTLRANVRIVTPHLAPGLPAEMADATMRRLISELHASEAISSPVHWFYTPMMTPWTRGIRAATVVYDCMDELSAFLGAPPRLVELEAGLLARADLVFTGGQSLYEAKRRANAATFAFPSAVDFDHFARARRPQRDVDDQAGLARPRIGFFGVIDERIDLALLDGIAALRPAWQLVLVGPVAKIDAGSLPRRANLHYLGSRSYDELPRYLAGWDVAIMPFARNEATRYISPTKTPEYLSGGKPVVSSSIPDVVATFAAAGLVRIADGPSAFVAAIEAALSEDPSERWPEVDAYLAGRTWDATWAAMSSLLERAVGTAAA